MAQWLTNPTRNHEVVGSIPGLARWVKEMQLGSGVAMALTWASSYSSDWIPSLGASICRGCGPKKTKKLHGGVPVMAQW